jgi:hypothetical protein
VIIAVERGCGQIVRKRGIADDQAMLELFEEVTDNTTPALAMA